MAQLFPVITVDHYFFTTFCTAIANGGQLNLSPGGPAAGTLAEDIFNAISFLFDDGFPPGSLGPQANPSGQSGMVIDYNAITVIIANGLDAPLKISSVYTKHGDNTGQPTWTHLDPKTGTQITENLVIPGRSTTIASQKYGVPANLQEDDMETFGIGVLTFTKAGGFWGVGGAVALTSDDPDFTFTPGLGFYKGLDNSDYAGLVATLQGGDATTYGDNVASGNSITTWRQSFSTNGTPKNHPGATNVTITLQAVLLAQTEVVGVPHPENSVFGLSIQKTFT